jgi:hypothetical protein
LSLRKACSHIKQHQLQALGQRTYSKPSQAASQGTIMHHQASLWTPRPDTVQKAASERNNKARCVCSW